VAQIQCEGQGRKLGHGETLVWSAARYVALKRALCELLNKHFDHSSCCVLGSGIHPTASACGEPGKKMGLEEVPLDRFIPGLRLSIDAINTVTLSNKVSAGLPRLS